MTRRATCLCVLALLACASLFVAPSSFVAAAASEEEEIAFAVAPEAAPEAAALAPAPADSAGGVSAEAFAMSPASAEQFGEREEFDLL